MSETAAEMIAGRRNEILPSGYSVSELYYAFDMVKVVGDWKSPINATINPALWPMIKEAIEFYTATTPRIIKIDPDNGRFTIVAEGYRKGPAGDH